MIIPGGLLIGVGVGILTGHWLAGAFIGLGLGFLLQGIIQRNRWSPWAPWSKGD